MLSDFMLNVALDILTLIVVVLSAIGLSDVALPRLKNASKHFRCRITGRHYKTFCCIN
jgi:hypothetical protein